jgi:hypothetical protein
MKARIGAASTRVKMGRPFAQSSAEDCVAVFKDTS